MNISRASINEIAVTSAIPTLAKGVAIALLGYLCVALMTVCGKMLAEVPTPILVFFQFFIGLLFSLPAVLRLGVRGLIPKQPKLILVRGLSGLLNVSTLFIALRYIPLIDAVVLQNSAPLFVPLILWVCFKKMIPHRVWIALAIGFIGVMLIVKPSLNDMNIGMLIGIASGFFTATSMVISARLKQKGEATARISLYLMLFSTVAMLPLVLAHIDIVVAFSLHQWLLLVLLGFFTYVCQLLLTHAFAHGSTQMIASLSYTTVAFGGLLGWGIWGHVPDWMAIVGILAVSMGGVLGIFWGK